VDRCRHAYDATGRLGPRGPQSRLCALKLRCGGANRELGGIGGFPSDVDIRLVRLELLFGNDAVFDKRLNPDKVTLGLFQRRPGALFFRTSPPERGPGAPDDGLRLGPRPRLEQRRCLGAHARHDLSALHAVARFQLNSQDAPRHGRGHNEAIAHPRHAFLVDRHDHRAGRDSGHVDLNGGRPQDDGKQADDDCGEAKNPTVGEQAQHGVTPVS
jgi:hypothetical protein